MRDDRLFQLKQIEQANRKKKLMRIENVQYAFLQKQTNANISNR